MRNKYKVVINTPRKMVEDPTNMKMLRTPCTIYISESLKDEFEMKLKIQNIKDYKMTLVKIDNTITDKSIKQSKTYPMSSPANELVMNTKIGGRV